MSGPIAVSFKEFEVSGCPHCGYRSGYSRMSGQGATVWSCADCGVGCVILAEGVEVSPVGFGREDRETIYPKLQPHPRRGIPKHGEKDEKPEGGGEFFSARGLGMDNSPGCFVCGGEESDDPRFKYRMVMLSNVAGFVRCKAAGERLVEMFGGKGCWMDYRDFEPDRVQVKIGACEKHKANLEKFARMAEVGERVVTKEIIEEARDEGSS